MRNPRAIQRLAVIALCLCGTVTLAACGDDDEPASDEGPSTQTSKQQLSADEVRSPADEYRLVTPNERYKVAFFTDGNVNTYLQNANDEAEKTAEATGIDMDVFSADFDVNKQLTQLQDAISSGEYQALVVESVDGEALCKPLREAAEDGLVVSVYNTPICGDYDTLATDGMVGYFGRNEAESGRWMVDAMKEALGPEGGRIAYITGPPQNSLVKTMNEAIDEQVEGSNLEIVARAAGDWDPAKGLAATQDIVQTNDELDGIIYGSDNMFSSSLDFLRGRGLLGEFEVVSLGGTEAAFEGIREGYWHATVNILPREEARRAIIAAVQTLNGDPVDVPGWDLDRRVYDTGHDPMYVGGTGLLTEDNLEGLTPQWTT